ncbi:MAG: family 20 glycosylhydrolase [Acidobacteria bacterium]|nr:family 20 glycosylhydrolase [Acidobacteriota bacterium]
MLITLFAGAVQLSAQEYNLMPLPGKLEPGEGRLAINASFSVGFAGYREVRLEAAAKRMLRRLEKQTGNPMSEGIEADASRATLVIDCAGPGETVQSVREDESYKLEVTATRARLTTATPVSVLRGIETFLQWVELDAQGFGARAVLIEDRPRFPWRGLMIDVCRHWMPMPVIKRNLDAMAAVKLNVLHWHLSEDQGFRIESKKYPRLHEMGSDGKYFTQEQVREVIAYARERGIRVVPEFDMPGHTTAWFVGYPTLASAPGPYSIERKWGIFDPTMNPTKEELYPFLDTFIGEMAALFPDEYFHIGGDEVSGKQWDASPGIQSFMRERGMKSSHDLQAHFNQRVLKIVQKHGKKMVGWDEILHPDFPKDIVIQSWRGQESLAGAARQGYMGILSFGYYLDHIRPAYFHYANDPLEGETAGLNAAEQARILGGEACMWAEFVTPENVDSRIWPRTAAIAERLWSPQSLKDVDSMYRRLEIVSRRLDWLGVAHRSSYPLMLERLVGMNSAKSLKTLADLLEPVKFYARGQSRDYTSQTPLNRLVDATRPESDAARRFASLVDNFSANQDEIRKRLALWRDDCAELTPLMRQSALLQEAVPLAEDVSALATAGLEALDYTEGGETAPKAWVEAQTELLARAENPRAELLIMIVPSIRKLVERAGQENR